MNEHDIPNYYTSTSTDPYDEDDASEEPFWERVWFEGTHSGLYRFPVPGGWLYRYSDPDSEAMAFVPEQS